MGVVQRAIEWVSGIWKEMPKGRIIFWTLLIFGLVGLTAPEVLDRVLGRPPSISEATSMIEAAQLSVQVDTTNCYGSGVMLNRGGQAWVLTAAHVAADVKKTDTNGIVSFTPVRIVAGYRAFTADIVAYCESEDLALLRVRRSGEWPHSATFSGPDQLPTGVRIFLTGCVSQFNGPPTWAEGIVGLTGYMLGDEEFDQALFSAWPGSSGGGVFLPDGRYVGMITRGAVLGSSLYIPMRRIIAWARRSNLDWIIDPQLPVPQECLRSVGIEPTWTLW